MKQFASNKIVRQALRQILVLIIVIIAAMLFAKPAEAQSGGKGKSKITRQISLKNNPNKASYILYKKRTSGRNRNVVASARRKKHQPMAETDFPKVASME